LQADEEDNVPSGRGNDELMFEQQPIDASWIKQEVESDYTPDDFTSDEEVNDHYLTNKNYCYVCGQPQSKISRHLLTHRNEEPDIAAILKIRKNSKERKRYLEMLRSRGNNRHNQEVLQTRCGELKVKRINSNVLTTAKAFATCLYCKSMLYRKELWRHMRRCPTKMLSKPPSVKTRVLNLVAAAESNPQNLSLDVRTMLSSLKKDEISAAVLNDSLLLRLAQCVYPRRDTQANNLELIKLRLRHMGRLLLALRKKSMCSFEDAVKLQNFGKVVEAVREIAGYNEKTKSCEKPSFLRIMGNSLKKISEINFARAWQENAGSKAINDADTFMKLCAKEWAAVRPSESKGNTPTAPFIRDVQLLHRCMEKTAASAVESLTLYGSPPVYSALLRVTAAQVFVLNRNIAQVSRATFESFEKGIRADLQDRDPAAGGGRSPLEQILSEATVRINLESNRGQKVTVALTPELLAAITLLVSKRGECCVHKNNPFLFGVPEASCTSVYHGHRCTLTYVTRCGAKNKAPLRSLYFLRHIERFFQILGLTGDNLERLAKLVGRDLPTDREYYRTPEAAGDIAKISELLSALQDGSLERLEGKSFEEIEIPGECLVKS